MENQNQNPIRPPAPGANSPRANMGSAPRPAPRPQPQPQSQPQPQPRPQQPPPAQKTLPPKPKPTQSKPPKRRGGLGTKILMILFIILILGVVGVSAYFYLGLSNKDSNLEGKINENKTAIADNKDKIEKLQASASDVDTLKQKVDVIEKDSAKYAESEKLETIITYLKSEDSDKDGLSDYDEVTIYKSSRYKKDTDGDGYTDKEEVDSGFNPSGPGKLSDADTSEDDSTTITGEWKGSMISTSVEAKDLSIKLDDSGKVTGSFSYTKDDGETTMSSRVTGTYTYKDNKLDAILINYFSVTSEDDDENASPASEEQYKMEVTGTLSKETKEIVGSWKIMDNAPANWPAGPNGSIKMTKNVTDKTEKLEDDSTSDNDSDDSTTTDDSSTVAKNISVKAFSYGYLPTTLTLTKGEKVKFEVTSLDVDHTFTIDDLDINVQVKGGQTSTLEFTPTEIGEYEYYSSISGQKDSGMKGTLTVEEESS